MIIRLHMK